MKSLRESFPLHPQAAFGRPTTTVPTKWSWVSSWTRTTTQGELGFGDYCSASFGESDTFGGETAKRNKTDFVHLQVLLADLLLCLNAMVTFPWSLILSLMALLRHGTCYQPIHLPIVDETSEHDWHSNDDSAWFMPVWLLFEWCKSQHGRLHDSLLVE